MPIITKNCREKLFREVTSDRLRLFNTLLGIAITSMVAVGVLKLAGASNAILAVFTIIFGLAAIPVFAFSGWMVYRLLRKGDV